MNLQYPELSIIGAPKCGTSSLHSWLSKLDDVNAAQPKETFYFMDADSPLLNEKYNFHKDGTGEFSRFFAKRGKGKTLDSTTHYYYQETAMREFARAGTKVLLVLRDPTQRLLSYFQYVCLTRGAVTEPIPFGDFTKALVAGDAHQYRSHFINEKEYYTLATCLEQGHYVDYIRQWQQHLDPDNFLILLFEDVVSDRQRWLHHICEFFELNVREDQIQGFKRENETVGIKYPRLNRLVKSVVNTLGSERLKQMGRGLYMKIQKAERPNLFAEHQDDIQRIYEYYEPYNQSLANQLNADLSRWSNQLLSN